MTEPLMPSLAPQTVLVVDDEESVRHFVARGLRRHGHEVTVAENGDLALKAIGERTFDAILLDVRMPGIDGLTLLSRILASDASATVLMMTAHGTVATAVEAMQLGAADYLGKPFPMEELLLRMERARAQRATQQENSNLRALLQQDAATFGLVGHSGAMRALRSQLDLLRASPATVLITGDSGSGKGVLARALHASSVRASGPFVTLHCAAVPDTLVESELFGHEPGAFTGAVQQKQGLVARAAGGTLFLDEIAEMSLPAQAKIERFLQDREFTPLGATKARTVDVRILAATNRDLAACVQAGTFRAELYWRLKVVQLQVPPLRDRRDDVPLLVTHQLGRLAQRGEPRRSLTPAAMAALTTYDWPGNVRELENLTERMAAMAGERTILGLGDLPEEIRGQETASDAPTNFESARERFERAYFTALLARCGGNVSEAAAQAGLSRGHLHRKLRELQCDPAALRDLGPDDQATRG
jgi:DNA-binding NtrC family response regulator